MNIEFAVNLNKVLKTLIEVDREKTLVLPALTKLKIARAFRASSGPTADFEAVRSELVRKHGTQVGEQITVTSNSLPEFIKEIDPILKSEISENIEPPIFTDEDLNANSDQLSIDIIAELDRLNLIQNKEDVQQIDTIVENLERLQEVEISKKTKKKK